MLSSATISAYNRSSRPREMPGLAAMINYNCRSQLSSMAPHAAPEGDALCNRSKISSRDGIGFKLTGHTSLICVLSSCSHPSLEVEQAPAQTNRPSCSYALRACRIPSFEAIKSSLVRSVCMFNNYWSVTSGRDFPNSLACRINSGCRSASILRSSCCSRSNACTIGGNASRPTSYFSHQVETKPP